MRKRSTQEALLALGFLRPVVVIRVHIVVFITPRTRALSSSARTRLSWLGLGVEIFHPVQEVPQFTDDVVAHSDVLELCTNMTAHLVNRGSLVLVRPVPEDEKEYPFIYAKAERNEWISYTACK